MGPCTCPALTSVRLVCGEQVRVVTDSEVCAGVVVELREGLLEKVRWHDV